MALSLPLYLPPHKSPPHVLSSCIFNRSHSFLQVPSPSLSTHDPGHPKFSLSVSAASSGARGLKAKFESMAEEKRKREEEEKAQQMARQQQERKAVVKMSREAQQPSVPVEEPAAPAQLPKKISSEVWPPAESHQLPESEPVRSRRECPVPSLPTRQSPLQNHSEDNEEPPALPPRTPEGLQVVEEPVYEAAPEPEPDYEDVGLERQDEDAEGDYEDVLEPEDTRSLSYQAGPSAGAGGTGISAIALYDYQGEGSDELSFDPDDIITDIEMVDEGWWRGQCRGHFGLFPANYVKLL